jgi:hypothetical protein
VYSFLLDEAEGVVVARVQAGATSGELTSGCLRAILALDGAQYRLSYPRVTLAIIDDDAEHFGPADRERIVRANRAVRHESIRLLVTRSGLHGAAIGVMKQQVDEGSHAEWRRFSDVEAALASCSSTRPGIDRVVRRLLGVLDASKQSAVVRTAAPVAPAIAERAASRAALRRTAS